MPFPPLTAVSTSTSSFDNRLLRLDRNAELITAAGGGEFATMGSQPGSSIEVALTLPQGIWLDEKNEVFFSDDDNRIIRHLSSAGSEVTNFATTPKVFHSFSGILQSAGALVADQTPETCTSPMAISEGKTTVFSVWIVQRAASQRFYPICSNRLGWPFNRPAFCAFLNRAPTRFDVWISIVTASKSLLGPAKLAIAAMAGLPNALSSIVPLESVLARTGIYISPTRAINAFDERAWDRHKHVVISNEFGAAHSETR